jgi:glycosyltransferase involved in cell wall biosynthesis
MNIFGYFNGVTGYGIHTRDFSLALAARRDDLTVASFEQMDPRDPLSGYAGVPDVKGVSLGITSGQEMTRFPGRYRIGWTVWETTRLPPAWVPHINQLDELWMSSDFGMRLAQEAGVECPVVKMHQGVTENFHPYAPKIPQLADGRFKFLFVGKWEKRKGIDVLLRAFAQEFAADEPVDLYMNAFNPFTMTPADYPMQRMQAMWRWGIPPEANVKFIDRIPDRRQMPSLYTSCDAFVIPTRGEGWCMPLIEAMACGLPCIATNHSALTEYFGPEVGYPLEKFELVDAADPPFIHPFEGSQWADPDVDELRAQMRYVYEHQRLAKAKGLKASEHVLEHFSWDKAAEAANERLKEVGA